jgi:hypothetical protein
MVKGVMDKFRLKQIFDNISLIQEEDIVELETIIQNYPYYNLPYIILAKYYYTHQNEKFDYFLKNAAIRVQDRKMLYEYIHERGDKNISELLNPKTELDNRETEVLNELNEDVVVHESFESLNNTQIVEDEIITQQTHSEELVEILQEDEVAILNDNTVKNTDSTTIEEAELENKQEVDLEEKQLEEVAPITNVNEFLKDADLIETEKIIEVKPIIEQEIQEPEIEFTISSNDFETIETQEETIDEPIIEVEDVYETDFTLSETKPTQSNKEDLLNLRKNPVYSIEHSLAEKAKEEINVVSSEMDFFEWLKHPDAIRLPKSQEENNAIEATSVKSNATLDLIEKFITVSPQISRPKKEFFSAENMAKKSEVLELDFVSETLAKLYVENGSFDLAIKVYEKLSLQNPSKKPYFASLIKKIKKENK